MPKLKKHADVFPENSLLKPPEHSQSVEETYIEDDVSERYQQRPPKMKYAQRVKLLEKDAEKHKKKKATKAENRKSSEGEEGKSSQLKQESQIGNFLSKYTDEDEIDENDLKMRAKKRKSDKQNKPEIKTKNKMFADYKFEQTIEQHKFDDSQQLDIEVEKKQKKEPSNLLQKFQKKADFCKNKLDYKDLNKDEKYKKNIHQTLKSIKQAQDVNLIIEVPKVLGGNKSEVETALFLKNTKERATQQTIKSNIQKQEDDNTCNRDKDRKTYYEELGKKLRMKKVETITESTLKQRFKKSMLDDQDYIQNSGEKNRINPFSQVIQSSYSTRNEQIGFKKLKVKNHRKSEVDSDTNQEQISYQSRKSIGKGRLSKNSVNSEEQNKNINLEKVISKQKVNEEEQQHQNNQTQSKNQDSTSQLPLITEKPTKNIKKKIKTFKYSNLVQFEAQMSDDEVDGGPKHNDQYEKSDIDEDTNLDSLIDDDFQQDSKDKNKLHKKFIKDMIEQQEKQYKEMKQKMEKKYIEEQERMKKRMQEVAKRNKEREEGEDKLLYTDHNEQEENSASIATKNTEDRMKQNEEKIKQLQFFLNGDIRTEKQVKKEVKVVELGQLDALEKTIMGDNKNGFKKVERKGMANVKAHKKPMVIKPKK